jgi:hypothetical protein
MSSETMSPLSPAMDELEQRWARLRSHKRAVASLRFLVEWQDGNIPRRANGVTVDVSQSGCMAVVGADLPLRRRVRIIRPENGRAADGEVVWRGHEAWDIGIALSSPDPSFWGVPF